MVSSFVKTKLFNFVIWVFRRCDRSALPHVPGIWSTPKLFAFGPASAVAKLSSGE